MNIYVPASSDPPSRRWKQKLSVVVVFGTGLAIAAVAAYTFERPDEIAHKAKLTHSRVPLPGAGFASLAPAQVSDGSIAPPTPHAGERIEPLLPQATRTARTQRFFTQPATRREPTALPPEQRYRPPPSSFLPPPASPEAPVETGIQAGQSKDIPSNLTVVGEGVYQVTSVAQSPPETIAPVEPFASDQTEAQQTGPVNTLRADDHGTSASIGQTCGPDQPAKFQDPAQTEQTSTVNDTAANSTDPIVDPQVSVGPAASLHDTIGSVESPSPGAAGSEEDKPLPAESRSPADTSAARGATELPPGAMGGNEAESGSAYPSAADAAIPCKVGVKLEAKPTVGVPIFLVRGDEPALRLSSLLDLIRADIPADDFQRLRGSTSADTILSIRDLVSAGFTFQIIGDAVAISATG